VRLRHDACVAVALLHATSVAVAFLHAGSLLSVQKRCTNEHAMDSQAMPTDC